MSSKTRVVLVRHGQTAWNREARFRGRADLPLDGFGQSQAQATGRYVLERWAVDAVYASPLQRALQTGAAIADAHGLSVRPFQGLLDIDFGEWEGRSVEHVEESHPELLQAWLETPHTVRFPDGETLDQVRDRVLAGLDELTERHAGGCVGMVGHTVVNRVLLCAVLGLGNEHFWRLQQETCAVNVFDRDDDGLFTLVLLNDTCHLQDLEDGITP